MEFKNNSKTRKWETTVEFQGEPTAFRISTTHPEPELPAIVEKCLARTEAEWTDAERNLVDALLDEYNDGWAEPEQGFPELSKAKFLDKLSVDHFSVGESADSFRLFFNDGGLFGGQEIEILWDADKMEEAALVG